LNLPDIGMLKSDVVWISPSRTISLLISIIAVSGCSLRTPAPSATAVKSTAGVYHTVKPGENLYRIGKAYDVPYMELARVNSLKDPAQIRIGQRIFIPGATQPVPVELVTPLESPMRLPDALDPHESAETGLIWPLNGVINSTFGPRGASFHDGIDISAPEGTPIFAIERGEVIYSDQLRGYGNIVIIRHSGDMMSVYAHNQVNLVRVGEQIDRGAVIGKVGSTGRVTGPHLHFEIRKNNAVRDPLRYLPQLCCVPASDSLAPRG
jgi:lipoprotein NlpD